MADFNTFNDGDVEGTNINIVDGTTPTQKNRVTTAGDVGVVDVVNTAGVYSTLTVGTTAVELKVGGSILTNRKLATLDNTSNVIIYWGYSNAITTTEYAGRIFKDQQASWGVGISIFLIAGSAGNTVRISEGA